LIATALGKTPLIENPHPSPKPNQTFLAGYEGTFQWDSTKGLQPLRFHFDKVLSQSGDQVVVEGRGVYLDTITRIKLRCELNTSTLEFKLYELEPEGPNADIFTTEGFHQGKFAPGFGSAQGRWVAPASGTLRLNRI
jgi:hypothetical protein